MREGINKVFIFLITEEVVLQFRRQKRDSNLWQWAGHINFIILSSTQEYWTQGCLGERKQLKSRDYWVVLVWHWGNTGKPAVLDEGRESPDCENPSCSLEENKRILSILKVHWLFFFLTVMAKPSEEYLWVRFSSLGSYGIFLLYY